ncbi:MAG: carboxymuconolactone decarboxylase family protein [Victivallaceae bacterium]|jgi:AhpD family alkylhydroperoxidase|nr:carboxymuconolactone decarboxylase family protein [Victivallaceae bacterium]MDD3703543.1 carboxymuconolactone decarboxylase family protein [Victivallaceae bacterium]MDD4318066.1 carboxymuconolactone decarboxylase family protein [Victivallaceae bacterium]MDD5664018.1 carboxymuconolactone decarboxylase family protein [Victivallaceae bacterium]NLK83321.1 carboxymuconolactone decarboxylase family protein [Lentisphaerota bacterium]
MATIKTYNKNGDAKAVSTQKKLEKKFGFIPEVFQAMGRNGEFLDCALQLGEVAGKGLDAKTKELISIAVSAVNGCEYCLSAHRAIAKGAGVTDEEITAAIEVGAMMSLYNNFNKASGLKIDIKAD